MLRRSGQIFVQISAAYLLGASIFAAPPTLSPGASARARALALYYFGTQREKTLDRPEALAAYEELLRLDPANTDVAMRAAELAAKAGRRSQGRKIVDASLEANADRVEPYLNLARYLDRYQPVGGEEAFAARALEVAEIAERRFPQEERVCELLVDLHLGARDRPAAEEAVRRFAERGREKGADFWITLGNQGLRSFALRGEGGDGDHAFVDQLFERALAASGGRAAVADAVANYHIEARQYQRAGEILQEVVDNHPERALEREKLARVYRILGRLDAAREQAEALVAAYPNQVRTQRMLADILTDHGEHEGAVRHRVRAIQLGGAEEDDFIELARSLAERLDPPRVKEALAWLERGVAVTPVSPRLRYMQGVLYAAMGRHDEATASYAQAETLAARTRPELLDEDFHYRFATSADRSGKHDEAARHFRRAVALVPPDRSELAARSLNDHAYMLLEQDGDVDAAGRLIRQALRLDPDNPTYLDTLGWYYYKSGALRKALVELRQAKLAMGDDVDPAVLEHIAAVRAALAEQRDER